MTKSTRGGVVGPTTSKFNAFESMGMLFLGQRQGWGRGLDQIGTADARRQFPVSAFNQSEQTNQIPSFQSHQAPGCRCRRAVGVDGSCTEGHAQLKEDIRIWTRFAFTVDT